MFFKDEYGNFGEATILLSGMTEITEEEYRALFTEVTLNRKIELQLQKAEIDAELAALEQEEAESEKDEQQLTVEEQASLLNLRANSNRLSTAQTAYIENRLNAISDYWDSMEGQVATYGTDN